MDKVELAEKLIMLNIPMMRIEKETGYPRNNLAKHLRNPELISNKWIAKLTDYLLEDRTIKVDLTQFPEFLKLTGDNAGLTSLVEKLQKENDELRLRCSYWDKRMADAALAIETGPKSTLTIAASNLSGSKKKSVPMPQKEIEPPNGAANESMKQEAQKRISQLRHEINNPPSKFTSDLAKKTYFFDRNKELQQLLNS